MPLGPTLETERLILRPSEAEDFDAFCEMYADEQTMKFLGGVQTPPEVWRTLCLITGAWAIEKASFFSIIEKATGKWIGRLGPWHPNSWPGTEVGWGLIAGATGRGYATEGAAAAMDYAVDILGWTTIVHSISSENVNSIKVAERLGSYFMRRAKAPAPFIGHEWDLYGQTADEWRENRKRFITGA